MTQEVDPPDVMHAQTWQHCAAFAKAFGAGGRGGGGCATCKHNARLEGLAKVLLWYDFVVQQACKVSKETNVGRGHLQTQCSHEVLQTQC